LSYRADGTVSYDSELSSNIHPRTETLFWFSVSVYALVHEPHSLDRIAIKNRRADRSSGPDLYEACCH
jgi:hypothetical protein